MNMKRMNFNIQDGQKFVTVFRPIVNARQSVMLGIRQPLDGPVFDNLEDAERWCIHAMTSHYSILFH
jgi:hypothetical protein